MLGRSSSATFSNRTSTYRDSSCGGSTCSMIVIWVVLGYRSSRTFSSRIPPSATRLSMLFMRYLRCWDDVDEELTSDEPAQWSEIEIQILLGESELLAQLGHPAVELHERPAEALLLLVAQPTGIDSPEGLALHELSKELHDREDELGQPSLEGLGVRIQAAAQHIIDPRQFAREGVEVGGCVKELVPHRSAKL